MVKNCQKTSKNGIRRGNISLPDIPNPIFITELVAFFASLMVVSGTLMHEAVQYCNIC